MTFRVEKSQWGWTAFHVQSGKAIAHAAEKALLTSYLTYLKECG